MNDTFSEPTLNGDLQHSATIGALAAALAAGQLKFKPVIKDQRNPYYNQLYADLSSVISATQPALAENGLVVIQAPRVDIEKRTVTVTTMLTHSSGEWLRYELELPATMAGKDGKERFDAQSIGSATTYGRRYSYQAIVGVTAEVDDDANTVVRDYDKPRSVPPKQDAPQNQQTTEQALRGELLKQAEKLARVAGYSDAKIKTALGRLAKKTTQEMQQAITELNEKIKADQGEAKGPLIKAIYDQAMKLEWDDETLNRWTGGKELEKDFTVEELTKMRDELLAGGPAM